MQAVAHARQTGPFVVHGHWDHYSMARCANLLIIVWYQTPTESDFGNIEAATAALVAECPEGIGIVIVVDEGNTKPPPAPVRNANAALIKRFSGSIWAMGRVLEGKGVKHTMVRLSLSTIALLSSSDLPERTVESVSEVTHWLSTFPQAPSASAAESAIRQLRAKRTARV